MYIPQDYQREFTKEVVKNTLLEKENKTLIEQVKESNKMIKCLNKKLDELASDMKQLKEEKLISDEVNSKVGEKIDILTSKIDKLDDLPSDLKQLKDDKIKGDVEINKKFVVLTADLKQLNEDKLKNNACLIDIIKEINELKKINELFFGQLIKMNVKYFVYKYIANKWKYIDGRKCCDNNCVNTDNPISLCSKGNGFGQIKSNTKIEYIYKTNGENKYALIKAENNFTKPIDELIAAFTLYYYEVKLIFKENEKINIGLRNINHYIYLSPSGRLINYSFQNDKKCIDLPSLTYKTNDIIGCGLVYPRPKFEKLLPYIFFTLNGEQIAKFTCLKKLNEERNEGDKIIGDNTKGDKITGLETEGFKINGFKAKGERINGVNTCGDKMNGESNTGLSIKGTKAPGERMTEIYFVYKYVGNKWKYIDEWKCCSNNCVNNNNPTGICPKGNGFPQIKSNTEMGYIYKTNEGNKHVRIESENCFTKPINEFIQTDTLYYYEIKLIFEKNEFMWIGFRIGNRLICLYLILKSIYLSQNKNIINLPSLNYKTNDIIGCGLVYPPLNILNKLPYIFFTLNGKQIGKAILIEEDCDAIRPYVFLYSCSIEANFGENSFIYNVSKHCVANEFYKKEEFE
ncbi:hypothetical protein Mgra_00006822 [Meloidogyne graminicola]|uniref:SPRY domain-containing protein n=1 Tax=Meloidogyne graminicola TaxID=189291 RepID=A0A8S9ZKU0_9BILA|nr:hypothetical protein Mgra_00006822 [Meloidogyne graminicola]